LQPTTNAVVKTVKSVFAASLVAQPLQSAVEQYRLSVKDCRKVFAGNRCEK